MALGCSINFKADRRSGRELGGKNGAWAARAQSHESICNLLMLFSMQILFSPGVNHLPGVPTLAFLNEKAGTDSQASGMSRERAMAGRA